MRSLGLWPTTRTVWTRALGVFVASGVFLLGCGGSAKEPVATAGAGPSSAGAGQPGEAPLGGSAAGGSAAGGSAAAGSAAGGESAAETLLDCDPRKIACKRATPVCGTFEVPSVEGSCYGDCVKIERCACSSAEQCPDNAQFTCWAKTHCGPYVR
jgi:hypothetical protein